LAWQSYGEAAKRIMATRAPELGWSPEAKQMILSWVDWLGWTSLPARPENLSRQETPKEAPVAGVNPDTVGSISTVPTATFVDQQEVQQIKADIVAVRKAIEQLSAGQDEVAHQIDKLQTADHEILEKISVTPLPPTRPVAAPPRHTSAPTASSSRGPVPLH
jgi:hypothetical protein